MIGITRTLRRQNHRLQEQADQLSDLLEREQDTVAELRESDRMKSDFVAATSHEPERRSPASAATSTSSARVGAGRTHPVAVEALAAIEAAIQPAVPSDRQRAPRVQPEHDDTDNAVFMFAFRIWSTRWWPTSTTPASASSARSPTIFLRSRSIGDGCRTCSSTWWTTR